MQCQGRANTHIQLKDENNVVIATARMTANSPGLQALRTIYPDNRLHFVDCDVSSSYGILIASEEISKIIPEGLDVLISNAGVAYTGMESFENM
jgi:NAD(P)-dependent dehydrogenase (short-subunit alcohol dehydrogenase family)